jgi:hypothetical protein
MAPAECFAQRDPWHRCPVRVPAHPTDPEGHADDRRGPWEADGGPGSPHVAPEGAWTGNSPTGPNATRLARQLALAYLVDRLVEDGTMTYVEVARQMGVSRARITQIASLRWLPVETHEWILAGEIDGNGAESADDPAFRLNPHPSPT